KCTRLVLAKRRYIVSTDNTDLRHAFVSLLIAERKNIVEIAKQAGHSPTMTLATFGHVVDELEGVEPRPAEEVIRAARGAFVRTTFPRAAKKVATERGKSLQKSGSPLTDSNRRPPPHHEREEGADPCGIPCRGAG